MTRETSRFLLGISVLIYAISFFLPAASLPMQIDAVRFGDKQIAEEGIRLPTMNLKGYQAFRRALNTGRVDWFANPILWVGFVSLACRRWLAAGIAGTISLGLGSLSVLVFDSSDPELKATFFVGYWLWMASMLTLAVTGWLGHWQSNDVQKKSEPAENAA